MKFEQLKHMFSETWPVLLPLMQGKEVVRPTSISEQYSASFQNSIYGKMVHLYDKTIGTGGGHIIFQLSFDTEIKYFSTVKDMSMRVAHWKPDLPRYYALFDPDNASDGNYTYVPYPCTEEGMFQLMTIQNTLEPEDYQALENEVQKMQIQLKDHPALSVGLVMQSELKPYEVLNMLVPFLKGKDQ